MRLRMKRTTVLVVLVTLHLSLFTVVSGCGKKAPPSPPEASALLEIAS